MPAGFLVLLLAALLRLPVLLHAPSYEFIVNAPFSGFLFNFLKTVPDTWLWSYALAGALVVVQGYMLNYTVSKHDILYKDTFLPGLFYVLICSLFPEQLQLTPQLISNTFLVMVFQRMCYIYESDNPLLMVFDAGMYLGMGIMFNYDLFVFLPFILAGVVIFTSFNLRFIIISLLGILLPLYFTAVFFYLTNRLEEVLQMVKAGFVSFGYLPAISDFKVLAPWLIIFPVALIGAFNLQQNFFRNKVKTRRITQSIGLPFVFGVLSLFIENSNMLYAFFYMDIALAIVLAYYFISTKRFILKEIIFYSLLAMAVYAQLRQ